MTGRDMVGNEGREIKGSKTMVGFEGPVKGFVKDLAMQ